MPQTTTLNFTTTLACQCHATVGGLLSTDYANVVKTQMDAVGDKDNKLKLGTLNSSLHGNQIFYIGKSLIFRKATQKFYSSFVKLNLM